MSATTKATQTVQQCALDLLALLALPDKADARNRAQVAAARGTAQGAVLELERHGVVGAGRVDVAHLPWPVQARGEHRAELGGAIAGRVHERQSLTARQKTQSSFGS